MRQEQPINIETIRGSAIKQRAISDALEYIQLLKTKAPHQLRLDDDGTPFIDTIAGETIIRHGRSELKISSEEMTGYLRYFAITLKSVLESEKKSIA